MRFVVLPPSSNKLTRLFLQTRFQTYWPHVDNIYSHRSTQKYKRKPFISHYWDCRLKGRPPGTPKSNDPNKKKRRRVARERDLCDVKIKITEYLAGATIEDSHDATATSFNGTSFGSISSDGPLPNHQTWSLPTMGRLDPFPPTMPGNGKYYTIQRVNGSAGDGKSDNAPEAHRHTLEESDRVKKNSVARWMVKREKENKKANVSLIPPIPENSPWNFMHLPLSENCCDNVINDCITGIIVGCLNACPKASAPPALLDQLLSFSTLSTCASLPGNIV